MQFVRLSMLAVVLSASSHAIRAQTAWRQYASPEEAGFSSEALDRIRKIADSVQSGAVMVVYKGNVLAAWGDVSRKLQLHSMRKSLTSALYGIAVGAKAIDLNATLADLGIDDTTKLTSAERRATVRDLISARSGVYVPAAYAPADQDSVRPPRGAFAPGTHWLYNNWDFNAAELVYAMRTRESVYAAFARQIAQPIGMDDFSPDDGFVVYEPRLSVIPANTWRMSARDMARFGQLYLQRGRWSDRQIIPAAWVAESTAPISDLGGGNGYGYMWWTYTPNAYGASYPNLNRFSSYAARGLGGHLVMVIPGADLVVVQRSDTDHNRGVLSALAIVEGVLAARRSDPKAQPRLIPLTPTPFASQLPPLVRPNVVAMDAREADALIGEYDTGQPERVTVTMFRGRPFIYLPGRGEAELLRVGAWEYTLGVVAGVTIRAEADSLGNVSRLTVRLGGRAIAAERRRS